MNNGLYTTVPPTLEYLPEMTPEEEMADYIANFDNTPDENEIIKMDLWRVLSQLDSAFHHSGYQVHTCSRSINRNPFHCTHGLETPKDEVEYLTNILDTFGIGYTVKDGAYKNTSGRWTNKRNAYVELENGIDDYYKLYARTDEIPFLVGDVII